MNTNEFKVTPEKIKGRTNEEIAVTNQARRFEIWDVIST